MKKIIIFLLILFSFYDSLGQGGFNIQYVLSDSINSSHIGESFRPDFGDPPKSLNLMDIRIALSTEDSAFILIDNKQILYYEQREVYDDLVLYENQYIVTLKDNKKGYGVIKDIKLLKIEADKFIFQAEYSYKTKREKNCKSYTLELVILAKDLAGIFKSNG
jgi:hypothetical protein